MTPTLERRVRRRARGRCEYCRLPRFASEFTFPIDHIIARQHGGATEADNLAQSCPHCNAHKGPNIAGLDPSTGEFTRLYHPRIHRWREHFAWTGAVLKGRTPIGRTTIEVLAINDPDMVAAREALIEEGRFPGR
ncbi:HNH endonuclease [Paludisphaera rhizosphaerae]|uniref:HNH endonuclease n=1 Tax=Paludisphaera rhizosphaerae TaxID=2711216 RepID=UPI0013ED5BB8|nr:HNH endonuclease signature motif containing protein [Paludisphaera rhizosphaerae]